MSESELELLQSIVLLSLAGIAGAVVRTILLNNFQKKNYHKSVSIFCVNIFATFLLGFLLSIRSRCDNGCNIHNFSPYLEVGFLGSLSTFSNFIIEILEKLLNRKWSNAFIYLFLCVGGGLLAAFVGYKISNF